MRPLTAVPLPILLGLCLAGSLACRPSEPWTSGNPEFALRAFLSALALGDLDTAREFLSPDTIDFLEANQRATVDAVGAEHAPDDPVLGLYRVWTPSAIDIDHIEVLEQNDSMASLAVHSVFGRQSTVTMHRSGDRWTIDLRPATADAAPVPPQSP